MPLHSDAVRLANDLLGAAAATPWLRLAEQVDAVEARYARRVEKAMEEALADMVWMMAQGGTPEAPSLEPLFEELWFRVMRMELTANSAPAAQAALAKPRGTPAPRSLKALQELYDQWRKGLWYPKRAAAQGKAIQDAYLKAVRQWWVRHSGDFLGGDAFNQADVVAAARRDIRAPLAQARTVVRTETTGYQNQVRRSIFDSAPRVTHYLFLSIRDRRTTPWCKTRHGIVLEKGTKLLEENTPAVHWNCRSEIVPLDPDNPKHAAMIADASRRASNRKLEPLPKDFRRT